MRTSAPVHLARLTQRRDYLRVARKCRKAVMPGLVLQAARPDKATVGQGPRIGFTASRKVGNAVARNRARRRLKSAMNDVFAGHADDRMDYVVIARAATVTRPYDELIKDLRRAFAQVGPKSGPGR